MNILSIDCSNGLKIGLDIKGEQFLLVDDMQKKQSDSLLTQIDNLLNKANKNINDIDVIAVCVGPGSFTGIRVAISTAKGLAIGAKTKVITYNSFEVVYAGLKDRNYGVVVEGFGNNYYYYFKKFGRVFQGCASVDKMLVLAKDLKVYTTSAKVKESITDFEVCLLEYNPFNIIVQKQNNQEYVQTNQIAPLYLRASQAEIEREKRGN